MKIARIGDAVELRLLGSVEAWSGQQHLDLGPRMQRLLLAILALHVDQPVLTDRLVDLTWPTRPPKTARHAIHVRVSRLRGTLATADPAGERVRITTRGPTYVLSTDPMSIDVHRFNALVANARHQQTDVNKVYLLRDALALWRGPALADVMTQSVDQLCRGLEEARLAASEERFDAELRLGRHSAIVGPLSELAAAHPYRQRLTELLMLALYRAGRAPEALVTYRAVRSRLVDEFALDPHARLQALEKAILCADPSLDPR